MRSSSINRHIRFRTMVDLFLSAVYREINTVNGAFALLVAVGAKPPSGTHDQALVEVLEVH